MVIIELTYKKPISEVERYLDDHKLFLDKNYQDKNFLASGAKVPRVGGVILSNQSLAILEELIKQDPFYKNEIADYRLIEFNPSMSVKGFGDLLQN